MQRGGKQGGVETPEVSNTVLEWALEPLARSWRERDMGFSFDDNSPALTHLLWADNIWIIAGSMEEFLCMTRELTDTILSIGFRWKDVSLEYMPCGSLRDCSSGALEGYTMVDHMMILGTYLHNDGNTMASLQHRLGMLLGICKVIQRGGLHRDQIAGMVCRPCSFSRLQFLLVASWQTRVGAGKAVGKQLLEESLQFEAWAG